jgi:KipI family sensor histidine kinase inhibitor
VPAGDQALSVELGDDISVEVNTRVRALDFLLQEKAIPGITEMVPSFRALLVYYDPRVVDYDRLTRTLEELGSQADRVVLPLPRAVEMPCCYDPELGLDLLAGAERLGLAPEELVRLHAGARYHLYFLGFTPGLPYIGGVPERIQLPRLQTPRVKVSPGSVGLGGAQCCIYSVESPGGYWILGRTPLRLYDPEAPDPILLRGGDQVTFRPIDRQEFDKLEAEVAARAYRPVIT